jgi:ABC-2 type transport system ATP-binding protein
MGVIDFLYFIARIYKIPTHKISPRISEMIRLCKLENEQHKYIRELSKGHRQRLGIAQALIHDPEIVILDEPTAGLDPKQVSIIWEIIRTIRHGKTIIVSSHLLNEIESTCDRIIMMSHGKIVADESIGSYRKRSGLRHAFRISIKGGDPHQIHQTLALLPGIYQISVTSEQNFEFQCNQNCEIESSIFNICRKNNWYIAELTPIQTKLEDLLLQVAQNKFACTH